MAAAGALVGLLAVAFAGPESLAAQTPSTTSTTRKTSTTSRTATTTTTTNARSTAPSPSTTTVPAAPDRPTPAFCDQARAQVNRLHQALISLTDPAELRRQLEDSTSAAAELGRLTPSDAQGAIGKIRDATAALRSALEPIGYDIAKLPPELLTRLQSPELLGATAELDRSARNG